MSATAVWWRQIRSWDRLFAITAKGDKVIITDGIFIGLGDSTRQ